MSELTPPSATPEQPNYDAYTRYYLFVTDRAEQAGITRETIRQSGGYDSMQTLLHNQAAIEHMTEHHIPPGAEHFERAREAVAKQVWKQRIEEGKDDEYRQHTC